MTVRRRRSTMRLINPFGRVERDMADERMQAAVTAVEALIPDLHDPRPHWFGGRLEGDVRLRYMAIGYTASPDDGRDEGRAFIVDIRSGHVIWQRPIGHRSELPRSVTALAE